MFPTFNSLTPGAQVPLEDMRQLNMALRQAAVGAGPLAKGSVGYPQQGAGYTGEIAPLVPQSIQNTLDSATFTRADVKFWQMLNKRNVTSTLHEETRINEHGSMYLDPWFAEGDITPQSEAEYERQVVRIKYLAEHIEVTDPATMVGSLGVNRNVLAQRTVNGTLALLGKLERMLFSGDSSLTALAFDGLDAQIRGGDGLDYDGDRTGTTNDNYTDLRGATLTPQKLQEIVAEIYDAPNHGIANCIMVEPTVFTSLVNIATAYGRHDQLRVTGAGADSGKALTFGHTQLFVGTASGQVEVKACPLMAPLRTPSTAAIGTNAPATPVLNGGSPSVTSDATSLFDADSADTYHYKVVAVGDGGISAPLSTSQAVAAGERINISIDDNGVAAGTLRYYRVYRGTASGEESWMMDVPRNGAGDTIILDRNKRLPNTGRVYIGQNTPDVLEWVQLLDFTRRPLAQVKTTVPFLLMLFGSMFLKVPTKWHALGNASLTV